MEITMKFMSVLALGLVASLSGCAVQKTLTPTGGSRADGTVKMSYSTNSFEIAKVDFERGVIDAAKRCRAWGYADAEPFGGGTTQCIQGNGYGCNEWTVTHEYQCTGGPELQGGRRD
jgi:hypothetical protein